ncbi:MAG: exodeoxyribonuclease VII large subunit [Clostridia bacterium]|mgnify:CR=1 FL=1|nr:exodeoxyribonuclease VII large subunit [Clostridia bacterium]
MLDQKILSVGEITGYVKNILEEDLTLANLWVRGEVSNFVRHTSGHLYFTLKDSSASLRCVMFRSRASGLVFEPENGMEVIARGYISLYPPSGQYQLYVEEMDPSGAGSLHLAYQQLKDRLEKEGLFDDKNKKPLPAMPKTIAVITSPTGAALRDVLNVINRRFPGVKILLLPTLVQGRDAPASISKSLEMANIHGEAELILLVRGGGSIEELWAFNTEEVARSLSKSLIPVLTGIGHELDFTIADFAADKRAPTPSAAAELAVPVRDELLIYLKRLNEVLLNRVNGHIRDKKNKLDTAARSRVLARPDLLLSSGWQSLDLLGKGLKTNMDLILKSAHQSLALLSGKLNTLSPLGILGRGYSLCLKESRIIRDSKEVDEGDRVEIILSRGGLDCQVIEKRRE